MISFKIIKRHEFWNPRIFETPFYIYLLFRCLIKRISIKDLVKADYALDHGDLGLGSKFKIQKVFDEKYFLPTILLKNNEDSISRLNKVKGFIKNHGLPIILKSDHGDAGRGILKINSVKNLKDELEKLHGDFICQKFLDYPIEYGVFYVKTNGKPKVTGINGKYFPTIIGNGKNKIIDLARKHERFTNNWNLFLKYFDLEKIPKNGEKIKLSFIGSHTMGCKFTDETSLLTSEIERKTFEIFNEVDGFNYGRLDVKAKSIEEFQKGNFKIIEVNGISSLPTNMFDPSYSLFKSYKIFFEHANYLVDAAKENKTEE